MNNNKSAMDDFSGKAGGSSSIRCYAFKLIPLVAVVALLQHLYGRALEEANGSTRLKTTNNHQPLKRVSLTDLVDLNDDSLLLDQEEEDTVSRQPILDLLKQAGLSVDADLLHRLPHWSEIKDLYGPKPVIIGMDTCKRFRRQVPARIRHVGVAGQMNCGTNVFSKYLNDNLRIWDNDYNGGMLANVPWNKHGWVDLRDKYHFAPPVDYQTVLPVVLIRDPYFWMRSK